MYIGEKMCNIYAGIVLYNPEIGRLEENITAIYAQVSDVVLFDNGSKNISLIEGLVKKFNNITLIKADKNKGIAAALNALMQWGENRHYKWMLSLDQDSICDKHYVSEMEPYLDIEPLLGIVAPVIMDRRIGVVGHCPKSEYSHVNTCITSGSFSRIDYWKVIGKYDESMFIDSVDFEYCFRMRKNGYGVIQVRDVQLLHEIGNGKKRRFLFWEIDVMGHSAFRKYYIARNNIYYPLKHHLWLHFLRGNIRNIGLVLVVILYEKDKKNKVKAICNGWKDAYMTLGKR